MSFTYLKELGVSAVELLPINYHLDEPQFLAGEKTTELLGL